MECVFCGIISKNIPSKVIWENDWVLAFENIKPVHSVHVLIIPKKHITNAQEAKTEDSDYLSHLLLAVPEVAKIKKVSESGYRLVVNCGKDSGQSVDHLHIHLIGGEELPFATG